MENDKTIKRVIAGKILSAIRLINDYADNYPRKQNLKDAIDEMFLFIKYLKSKNGE